MPAFDLPPELKIALAHKAEGLSRNDAAKRAGAISENYRGGSGSKKILTESDALAYAIARMPATYAAVGASLHALQVQRPEFQPQTLLDVGAGPATASWAAAQAFPSLTGFSAIDSNFALRSLALDTVQQTRLANLHYAKGDVISEIVAAGAADLVIASYVVNELDEAKRDAMTELMWQKTRDILVVVEPGTPAGHERIIALRAKLIAQGAHVIAPCPHDRPCPLMAPDWCHFSQRLARSRAHMHLKGAEVPFEDERFSYVALSRTPARTTFARVLAQPSLSKVAVSAKLCTLAGVNVAAVPRRDKPAYAAARRWVWGDAVSDKWTE